MEGLKKAGKLTYKLYIGVGMLGVALIACSVIFTVFMRYFFNISFIFLEELVTVMFTFTTFWGIGAGILENEHIGIDVVYQAQPKMVRHILDIVNTALVIFVNAFMIYLSTGWIEKAGKTYSNALRIQLKYIYVILPIGCAVGVLCGLIKLYLILTNQEDKVSFKPEIAEDDIIGQMERNLAENK